MTIELIDRFPLSLVVRGEDTTNLDGLDAGTAFTAFLHRQSGQFPNVRLGNYVDVVRTTVNPSSRRHAQTQFEYIDLREVDDIFGQVLDVRRLRGREIGSTKVRFRKNDLLFAKIMPSLENKKVAFVNIDVQNAVCSTEFIVLRRRDDVEVSMHYIFRAIRADAFTQQAIANVTGATGRQRISPQTLLDLKIPIPPTELQRSIGLAVEKEFDLRALAYATCAEADEISQAVLGDTTRRVASATRRASRRGGVA